MSIHTLQNIAPITRGVRITFAVVGAAQSSKQIPKNI
jgi:hypothetical protein